MYPSLGGDGDADASGGAMLRALTPTVMLMVTVLRSQGGRDPAREPPHRSRRRDLPAAGAPRGEAAQVAALCHELRTYLAAGLSLVDLMASDEQLPAAHRARVALLREQLSGMAGLVASELNAAREVTEPVDMAALVERCTRMVGGNRPPAMQLRVHSRPVVLGRCPQLQRAITGLLDNACRAMSSRPVRVDVGLDGARAAVSIEDDGPGFGQITLGTGQGLEQARSAAMSHGGSLSVRPGGDGGTRVELRLPLHESLAG